MKNVLVIIGKLGNGGAEKKATFLSSEFKNKYNVTMVVFNRSNEDYIYDGKIYEIKELQLIGPKTIFGLIKLRKIKKELKIDVSISFGYKACLFNTLTKYKDKVVISIINMISLKNNKVQNFIYKRITLKKADVIIPVSNKIKYNLINNYNIEKEKIKTIYNPCNKNEIDRLKDESISEEYINYFNTNNTVINIGRLNKQKGQIYLIKAFEKVVEEIPNSKLAIFGRGEEYETLKRYIDKKNLNKNILLAGFEKNIYKYINNSTMLILTSKFEGMPNSILEAMYLGIPIVSTDCDSGPREILEPNSDINDKIDSIKQCKYGILFPNIKKNNLTDEEYINYIKDSIINMLKNKVIQEKYKNLSKERIKDFDYNNILKEWYSIIEE